jgi:hypothetical protein
MRPNWAPRWDSLVLDMGEPVRMMDLAYDIVRLAGREAENRPIETARLRPGKKLHAIQSTFPSSRAVSPMSSAVLAVGTPSLTHGPCVPVTLVSAPALALTFWQAGVVLPVTRPRQTEWEPMGRLVHMPQSFRGTPSTLVCSARAGLV